MTIRWDWHMDIMEHRRTYTPAVGRTPGGFDFPVAVDEAFPPLPPATGVTVGVVDTGLVIDANGTPHPWFGDHVSCRAQDQDLLQQGTGSEDERGYLAEADGHGTFVTGLILREAPSARVVMHGALDKDDDGDTLGKKDDERVADAVRSLALDPDVQVINLSFGGGEFTNRRAAGKLAKALEDLDGRVAVVAAAGNGAGDRPVYPAAFDGVISVGALDESRLRPPGAAPAPAAFSNHGDWVRAFASGVQVLGPYVDFDETGSDVFGLRPPQHFRGWARWSGTSFAAATVSGRIAQTAILRGITGAEAADVVLGGARSISGTAVWVQGTVGS